MTVISVNITVFLLWKQSNVWLTKIIWKHSLVTIALTSVSVLWYLVPA